MPKDRILMTWYADPGHAWLEVPQEWLFGGDAVMDRGILSECSYVGRGDGGGICYFLEEDCDAPLFLAAMKRADVDIKFGTCQVDRFDEIGEGHLWQLPPSKLSSDDYHQAVRDAYEVLR